MNKPRTVFPPSLVDKQEQWLIDLPDSPSSFRRIQEIAGKARKPKKRSKKL